MTTQEAIGQAFENGHKQGYARGLKDAVKHGRWSRDGNRNTHLECGFFYLSSRPLYNYCPNCGAKMDAD